MTLGRMLSREEPSAGCSGRAESHTPLGSGSAIVGKYSSECDRTSRKDDQLLMLPASGRCKTLTALRSGPDLSRPQRSPRSGPYYFQSEALSAMDVTALSFEG